MARLRRYLFLVTKPYSISILEPVQEYLQNSNIGTVRWFAASQARDYLLPGEVMTDEQAVQEWQADAVLVPGNLVPHNWPGLKVQIFHGLGEEKPGHYRIVGLFDLYCTPGPSVTEKFNILANKHKHFAVTETGWPKLDRLPVDLDRHTAKTAAGLNPDLPVILYAPTFSPRFASADILKPAIISLQSGRWQWVIKFHPLMNAGTVESYRCDLSDSALFPDTPDIAPYLLAADLLVTDTSSVAYEFLYLDRPVITCRAATRADKGIDIRTADELGPAIERALAEPDAHLLKGRQYMQQLHPYRDGQSSARVARAVEEMLATNWSAELRNKPINLMRKYRAHKLILS